MNRIIGTVIILLGAAAVALPFVGPLFGFGMGPDPVAWEVTQPRIVRHVIPGAAIILGGLLLLPRARASHVLGGALAVVGGVWLTLAPVVLGRVTDPAPALVDVLRPLTYHYGTGLVIVALAAYALGAATVYARAERPAGRHAAPERETVGAERR